MAITLEQVRAALEPEEPNYEQAAQDLGSEALPHLSRLIAGDHLMLASKATYLAGLIGTEQAAAVIRLAARHSEVRIRVAAAAAAQHLPQESASDVLLTLIDDLDVGVQKVALRSVPIIPSAELRSRVEALSVSKADTPIRQLSRTILQQLSP